MGEPVQTELRDGVLLVTLNRPEKKNAFNDPQWDGLRDALNRAREDDRVAVLVVTGAGKDFSAGQDLTAFGQSSGPRPDGRQSGYYACMDALFACDVVYVGESVRLRLPFVALGLVPEAASSYTLQARIGTQRAAELFYTAQWIDAAKAVETGIALKVFPDDELLERTLALAHEIAQFPVGALRATKRTLMAAHAAGVHTARQAEDEGMAAQAGSPENIEAIKAFLEKRAPVFRPAS